MKNFKILTSFFLSIPFFIAAQQVSYKSSNTGVNATTGDYRRHEVMQKLTSRIDNLNLDESKIVGSKYFNDKFLPGKIFVDGKVQKEVMPVRYNAYADVIEIQNGDNNIEALVENEDIACSIFGQMYVYLKYIPNKKKSTEFGYLKVVHKNDVVTFFLQQTVKFKEAKPAKTSHSSSFPAKFIKSESYYFLSSNKEVAIPLNKKSLLSSLDGDKIIVMKSYLKKQRINFTKDTDVKKLFNFYNTL